MAIWQYSLEMFPKLMVEKKYGFVPDSIELESLSEASLWRNTTISDLSCDPIKHTLAPKKGWHEDLALFGDIESDCIEIWCDSNRVICEMSCRVDARNSDVTVVLSIFDFCSSNEILLYSKDHGVRCTRSNIASHISASSAGRFLDQPENFIRSLNSRGN